MIKLSKEQSIWKKYKRGGIENVIGIGITAFLVYIIFVMIWYLLLKRSIAEAMLIGLVIVCAFNGVGTVPQTFVTSLKDAVTQDVMAAIILFTFMSSIMMKTGIIHRLVDILNSILGRFRGGPAYVSACASALFGMVSGASSANAATVGSITIPWMKESGWPKEVASTMNTGNAGLGICIPPSSSMFLMLGLPAVAGTVKAGDLYFALLCGGLWTLVYRLLLTRYYVSKYHIPAVPKDRIESLGKAVKKGGSSLFMFLGIAIPLVIITGPVGKVLETVASFGEDAVGAMNIIIWVPVLIMAICMIEGRRFLPKTKEGWFELVSSSAKTCCSCGAVSLFAMAGSNALTETGFGDELTVILASLTFPKVVMLLIIGFIIALVAGPLNATSTTVSIGPVAYSAMVAVGVSPVTAVVCYLIFASTEGASPPMSSPIFVSSSIAGVEDVSVMFKPLIFHYCIPIVLVGVLVGLGILPLIGG
ncbi:C4-dicarboxylate ABC transporter permease [Clostridium sp. AM29-11AC]|nr:TRAP transporter, DctM-like membrane protein [Clostridium sp. M62/1]RHT58271.1 C4-dicarboxylate ABC transporter permease [Clostridium sp. AM29-11AC]